MATWVSRPSDRWKLLSITSADGKKGEKKRQRDQSNAARGWVAREMCFFLCFVLFFFDKMSQKDSGFSSISELAVVFFLLDKTDRVVSTRDSKPQKVLPRLQEFP